MAAVLNRTTKQYLQSANTPDYPIAEWIHNPDMSAVVGFDARYWTISGDTVSLMSQAERDAVDVALRDEARQAVAAQLQQTEDILRAFMLIVLGEFNSHALKSTAILNAIDNGASLAAIKTAIAAITDYPQRTEAQLRAAIRNRLGT